MKIHEQIIFSYYAKIERLAILFKNQYFFIAALPIAAISPKVDFYSVVSLLFWLFVIDLITGLF